MSYGRAGGENWIWDGVPGEEKGDVPLMWGGDKTYIGPHSMWRFTQPTSWPPPAPDAAAHEVEVNPEPAAANEVRPLLRTTSPEWPGYGARVIREYTFAGGELVTTHRITAVPGSGTLGAVWVITQTIADATVFVPLNPKSPYKDGVFWFGFGTPRDQVGAQVLSPSLLRVQPITGTGFKLGADPKRPALAAVKNGLAFVQRSVPQEGQYPEGADEAGLSVEVYHHNLPPPRQYTELELLSPLRRMDAGATLVTRWNIHELPRDGDVATEVERLLQQPTEQQ
jgi:hypothetical protein